MQHTDLHGVNNETASQGTDAVTASCNAIKERNNQCPERNQVC